MSPEGNTGGIGRPLVAEFIGTASLLLAVVGSGIMAQQLSTDTGLQLLENALATGAALLALILTFGSVSGAHFNPVISIVDAIFGGIAPRVAAAYIMVQVAGAIAGVVLANLMFELDAVSWSGTDRMGSGTALAEVVATIGLVVVIFGAVRSGRANLVAFAVAAYITGAYWFTASTSFANPAVTIGRMFSDSFAGIAPGSVPVFLMAQMVGLVVAAFLVAYLFPDASDVAGDVTQPHEDLR